MSHAWHLFQPHVKLKILLGFYLIATRVDSVYEVALPFQVKQVLAMFAVTITLGIGGISVPLECIGLSGYRNTLVVYLTSPVVLVALLAMVALVRTRSLKQRQSAPSASSEKAPDVGKLSHAQKNWEKLESFLEAALPLVLRLLFLLYPLVKPNANANANPHPHPHPHTNPHTKPHPRPHPHLR